VRVQVDGIEARAPGFGFRQLEEGPSETLAATGGIYGDVVDEETFLVLDVPLVDPLADDNVQDPLPWPGSTISRRPAPTPVGSASDCCGVLAFSSAIAASPFVGLYRRPIS
jgi:hypothetical protein